MTLIIITVVLGTFLFVTCVLLACLYYRWRKAKQRPANREAGSNEPTFFFQPETPVFLIGRNGGHRKTNKQQLQSTSNSSNDSSECHRKTASDMDLYSRHPQQQVPVRKKSNLRHLYASIDKFFKGKNKSSGSLDEGYTTDDNYDYRRFAAFPKDDDPGSIVSSTGEPEYRIPEDFITSHMSVSKNHLDSDYLQPSNSSLEQKVLQSLREEQIGNSSKSNKIRDIEGPYEMVYDTQEGHGSSNLYDKIHDPSLNQYDQVGEVMVRGKKKMRAYDTPAHIKTDYEVPEEELRQIYSPSHDKRLQVIENANAVGFEDGPVPV